MSSILQANILPDPHRTFSKPNVLLNRRLPNLTRLSLSTPSRKEDDGSPAVLTVCNVGHSNKSLLPNLLLAVAIRLKVWTGTGQISRSVEHGSLAKAQRLRSAQHRCRGLF
ncbi:hypothetical protein BaRGS_00026426 [Batillaria attramentaria]|uniref:Uncharacterized protein n=1 Tax=Batillaria attramentaria TaxID=370345 RepID=A0ABD0K5D1_9CAEN